MATLAELQAHRAALEAARYSGNRRVRVGGTEVEFKSDSEMAAALADLDQRIKDASGTAPPATFQFIPCKGY